MNENTSVLKKEYLYKFTNSAGVKCTGVFDKLENIQVNGQNQVVVVFKNRANLSREAYLASDIQDDVEEYGVYIAGTGGPVGTGLRVRYRR
ncbi:hypothetical protein ACYZTM_04030 [Pseudomonas sp. MDT2-39-1]